MMSETGDVSHRRFISLSTFFLIVVYAISALFGIEFDIEILWSLVTLCGASSGLTLINPQKGKRTERNLP